MRLAMAYREQWGRDVVIDLIGYRRYGHNETDEPAYTQPKMAAQIKEHPPVSEIYAEQLIAEGVVTTDEVATDASERLGQLHGDAQGAAGEDGGRRVRGPELDRARHRRARPDQEPRGRDRRLGEAPADRSTRSCCGCPTASPSTASCASRCSARVEKLDDGRDRVRPRRGARLRLAAHRGHATSASPARTPSAARSRTATWPSTTRTPACATCRSRTSPARWRRSSSTTARSRRPPASASSTATRRPRRSR